MSEHPNPNPMIGPWTHGGREHCIGRFHGGDWWLFYRHPDGQWVTKQKLAPPGDTREQPNVICLCGSSRFVDVFAVLAWELEKQGNITHSIHLLPHWYATQAHHQAEAEGVADNLDALHLRKIDLSDEVIVVDVGGYFGESTTKEIAYAKAAGKPVRYLSKEPDLATLTTTQEEGE